MNEMFSDAWAEVYLGRVAEIVMGQSPPGYTYNHDGKGLPLINGPVEFGQRFPTKIQWTSAPSKTCRPDDILFCVRGSTTGRMNVSNDTYCIGRGVAAIRGRDGISDTAYLELILRQLASEILEEARGSGSTFPSITGSRLGQRSFLLPSLPQQCKIARILATLDNLIEKTEALIAKYQAMKQGMMHDLFTRGVDTHGHLRPPYAEVPELYKESELGWIPKEWASKTLNEIVSPNRPIVYGILMPGYGHPGGVPVIKVKDIKNGVVDTENLLLTSPEIDRQYRRSKTNAGDLLFTIRGTVGRTAFVPQLLDGANITQDTARVGIIEGDARFIRGYLEMPVPASFITTRTLGVAVQGINLGDVRKIPIACPPPCEQNHVGDILELQDKRLRDERQILVKLQILKSGIMQDLLTGKVRVKVDEEAENV